MDINRYNYEEYFLLYTDNELNIQDRAAVEEFITMNPDLREELDLLQQYIMVPEEVVFPDKMNLLKTDDRFIDAGNYEERFLLYADNELNGHHRKSVEQYIHNHPELKEKFGLINRAVLTPDDSVHFPDKQSLLRYEDEKVIAISWWKMAAAAMVVLVAGALWLNNQSFTGNMQMIAQQKSNKTLKQEASSGIKRPGKNDPSVSQPADNQVHSADPSYAAVAQENKEPEASRPEHPKRATDKVKSVASLAGNVRRVQSKVKSNIEEVEAANNTAFNTISSSVINNQKSIIDEPVAISSIPDSDFTNSGVSFASNNDTEDVYVSNIPVDKKHALRGLFRKASRMINKATGINTGEKGILIGNVELALK